MASEEPDHKTNASEQPSSPSLSSPTTSPPPHSSHRSQGTHSIRALHTDTTITVYQAYHPRIADPAVSTQNLLASPHFSPSRMTWIKPSWNWMLYRSGYSYKDANQSCILAITMTISGFEEMLSDARVAGERGQRGKGNGVVVQWDPERTVRIGRVEGVRSLQVGIPGGMVARWAKEWIVKIEDVTGKARELKRLFDEESGGKGKGRVSDQVLRERSLVFEERVFDRLLSKETRRGLRMDVAEDEDEVKVEVEM